VDNRYPQPLLGPGDRWWVGAFAGQEQRAKLTKVAVPYQSALRVFTLDRAERGGRREEDPYPMLLDDPPERAGVGRADRLALVHDGGAAKQQRGVDYVGMADHPADIGGGPEHLVGLPPVDVAQRPMQRHGVPAIVAHHP